MDRRLTGPVLVCAGEIRGGAERSRRLATSSIPIIGPRSLAQLDDYLGALDLELTQEQYDVLTDVRAVPHDANAAALNGLLGGVAAHFESPAVPVA